MASDKETNEGGGAAAVAPPKTAPKKASETKPAPKPPKLLPLWKVLLHNDNKNSMDFVVAAIVQLTRLDAFQAIKRMLEAHRRGLSLLLTTHRERAELYQEQFQSKGLKVTIEPTE